MALLCGACLCPLRRVLAEIDGRSVWGHKQVIARPTREELHLRVGDLSAVGFKAQGQLAISSTREHLCGLLGRLTVGLGHPGSWRFINPCHESVSVTTVSALEGFHQGKIGRVCRARHEDPGGALYDRRLADCWEIPNGS